MRLIPIQNYDEFMTALLDCGFSLSGGSSKGFALIPFAWDEPAPYKTPVRWHTGDPNLDPWEWRMRVLEQRDDVAYAKLFFGLGGYITREYYPLFLSIRRQGESFAEAYERGSLSYMAKRVYHQVEACGQLPLHELRRLLGIGKEESAEFSRALTELQMHLFLTLCGRQQKRNAQGEPYGWNSTVLCTTETFWAARGGLPDSPPPDEAFCRLTEQALLLEPTATKKRIERLIRG